MDRRSVFNLFRSFQVQCTKTSGIDSQHLFVVKKKLPKREVHIIKVSLSHLSTNSSVAGFGTALSDF